MNLRSNYPFWPKQDGIPSTFPTLTKNINTEIVIVGAGISGALVALAFHDAGYPIAVLDKRKIAHGSTSASTALLQYEIDLDLVELIAKIGRKKAERAYHLCGNAIKVIENISSRFACDFVYQPSLYFAREPKDIKNLKDEFECRKKAGFNVEWLDSLQLKKEYGILSPGAIRSKLGASIDPYLLTYKIFDYLQSQGICIFEETTIKTFNTDNTVILTTKNGNTVTAKHLIFAAGYETQNYLKEKIVNLKSTYAFITKPLIKSKLWKDRALLWDTGDPYLYVRLTPDNRILIGGADLVFRNSWLRDILIARRTKRIVKQFHERIPEMQFEIDRRWSGTFGETKDGLGYIGSSPEWKNTSFALGFGGNGITYSAIAGDLLIKQYQGKEVHDLELFNFGR